MATISGKQPYNSKGTASSYTGKIPNGFYAVPGVPTLQKSASTGRATASFFDNPIYRDGHNSPLARSGSPDAQAHYASLGRTSGGGGGGGGSSGGGSGGYAAPAPEPSFDANAYMQMIMNIQNQQMEAMQRAADEQASLYRRTYDEQMAKLRASVGEANTNVDKNAASTIGTMRGETDEQLRQANIARQQAERVQQQSSYLSGAGGASESAMMDVNNTYQNSRDRYNTAFSTSQKDVLGQADNLKATNNQSLTQSEVGMMNNLAKYEADLQNSMAQNQASFASQIPQYALQLASLGPQYAGAVDFNALSAAASKAPRTTYAQLRAQGKSDEEIRKLLGM